MPIYEYRLCPLAVALALQIREAVAQVEGVTGEKVEVVSYVGAKALNVLLKEGEE
jgi:metal-sulfur cluster biosynthetic enzyme